MKNTVTISIHFYFKGKKHSPALTVELDELMLTMNDLSHFYPLLAKENNYDLYSYEYEMMQAEELHFSNAQGLIADFITNNKLDTEAFLDSWHKNNRHTKLVEIAEENIGINKLADHPDIINALHIAFELGQKSPK